MPLYHYDCPTCGSVDRLLSPEASREPQQCRTCGVELVRAASGAPTTVVKEIVDNGLMTRKVERLADAERLTKERGQFVPERGLGKLI